MLAVPWSLDSVVRASTSGVAIPDDASDSGALVGTAVALGHALGADEVIVLAVHTVGGHRAIVGYAIEVQSQSKTFAAVQIEPVAPSAETLAKLAALLAGDRDASVPGLIIDESGRHAAPAVTTNGNRRGSHTSAIVVGAVGIAALAGAGGFDLSSRSTYDLSKAEPDLGKQRTLYDSANLKYKVAQGLALGGVACVAAAAILWVESGHSSEETRVSIMPSASVDGFGLSAVGSF